MSKHNFALRCLTAAVATALAAGVQGEEATTLGTVVVTGTYIEHDPFDLPAAIEVLGRQRLQEGYNRVNVSDPMAAVPGVVVQNRQNYAQDLQISSRGFGARSAFGVRGVKLIADGIPATMPDGQGQAATFNLDAAERLEVLRGPFSVVYGNHAGGVVQLFTKDGQGAPTLEGSVSAGSYGTWKADVGAQGEKAGVGYVLDSSRFATEGYRDHSSAVRDQGMAKLTLKPVADGKLTLVANVMQQKDTQDPLGLDWQAYTQNPRGVAQNALDYNTRKSIDHAQGGLNYEHRLGNHTFQVAAFAGSRQVIQYQSIPKATQANVRHSGGVIDFDRQFYGVDGRWIARHDLGGSRLTTTLGMSYERSSDDRRGYENFIGSGSTCGINLVCGVKGNLRRQEDDKVNNFSPYAAAEWQRGDWVINTGVRYSRVAFNIKDQYLSNGDDSGRVSYSSTTPNLGLLYKLTPALNVYASVARGFESPTLNELFYSGSGGGFNFGLKAATSRHFEVGAKALVGSDSLINLALFQVNTRNELVVDASVGGRTSYKNAATTLRQGLELSASTRWARDFSARLAATAMRATYDESFIANNVLVGTGNRIPGVPDVSLFGELAWQYRPWNLNTAIEGQAQGRVYVEDTNTVKAAPGFGLVHLRAGLEQKSGAWQFKEFLRLNNVFDRQYIGSVIVADTNGRYYESAPTRNWLLGMTARYAF